MGMNLKLRCGKCGAPQSDALQLLIHVKAHDATTKPWNGLDSAGQPPKVSKSKLPRAYILESQKTGRSVMHSRGLGADGSFVSSNRRTNVGYSSASAGRIQRMAQRSTGPIGRIRQVFGAPKVHTIAKARAWPADKDKEINEGGYLANPTCPACGSNELKFAAEPWFRCGACGLDYMKIKKSVVYGTRPFARRGLPKEEVKQVRAKAPRYAVKSRCEDCGTLTKSVPLCGDCFRKAADDGRNTHKAPGKPQTYKEGLAAEHDTPEYAANGGHDVGEGAGQGTRLGECPRCEAAFGKPKMRKADGIDPRPRLLADLKQPLEKGIYFKKESALSWSPEALAQFTEIKKSMDFKVLDENDPEYHGHTGGGAGYAGKKWVHSHGPTPVPLNLPISAPAPSSDPKSEHKHFKMGAWTTHHSPTGYREEMLGDHEATTPDPTCALPNCGHPESSHRVIPGDQGRTTCVGCAAKKACATCGGTGGTDPRTEGSTTASDLCTACRGSGKAPRRNFRHEFKYNEPAPRSSIFSGPVGRAGG